MIDSYLMVDGGMSKEEVSKTKRIITAIISTTILTTITIGFVSFLFIWIISTGPPPVKVPDLNATMSSYTIENETYYKILITEIDWEPLLKNVKYRVYNRDGISIEEVPLNSEVYGNLNLTATYHNETLGVGFADTNANNRLSVGDYFLVKQHFSKKYASSIDMSDGGMSIINSNGDMLKDIKFTI